MRDLKGGLIKQYSKGGQMNVNNLRNEETNITIGK